MRGTLRGRRDEAAADDAEAPRVLPVLPLDAVAPLDGATAAESGLARPRLPGTARLVLRAGLSRLLVLPITAALNLLSARIIWSSTVPQVYGVVLLISTLGMLLPFADFGVGAPIMTVLASSADPSNDDRVLHVLRAAFRTLLLSAVGFSGLALLLFVTGSWGHVLGSGAKHLTGAPAAATTVVVAFALALPLSSGQRVLIGMGRTELAVLLSVVAAGGTFGLVVLLHEVGAASWLYAVAAPVGACAMNASTFVAAARVSRLPLLRILRSSLSRAGRATATSLREQALPMLVLTVAVPVALQTDRLVLSHAGSASSLTAYALAAVLYAPAFGLAQTAATALWPVGAERRAGGHSNAELWRFATLAFVVMGAAMGLALIAFGPVMARWLSHSSALAPSTSVWVAFGLLLALQVGAMPTSMLLTTTEGLRFQAACAAAFAGVKVVLSLWLARPLGASGPVIASCLAVAALLIAPTSVYAWKRGLQTPVQSQ